MSFQKVSLRGEKRRRKKQRHDAELRFEVAETDSREWKLLGGGEEGKKKKKQT